MNDGKIIRISIPLTEERRRDLVNHPQDGGRKQGGLAQHQA
jgi:ribosome recycling factor